MSLATLFPSCRSPLHNNVYSSVQCQSPTRPLNHSHHQSNNQTSRSIFHPTQNNNNNSSPNNINNNNVPAFHPLLSVTSSNPAWKKTLVTPPERKEEERSIDQSVNPFANHRVDNQNNILSYSPLHSSNAGLVSPLNKDRINQLNFSPLPPSIVAPVDIDQSTMLQGIESSLLSSFDIPVLETPDQQFLDQRFEVVDSPTYSRLSSQMIPSSNNLEINRASSEPVVKKEVQFIPNKAARLSSTSTPKPRANNNKLSNTSPVKTTTASDQQQSNVTPSRKNIYNRPPPAGYNCPKCGKELRNKTAFCACYA